MIKKLTKFFLLGVLFFLPFGVRVLVHQFIPGFHEYESAFVYASDIFMILFLVTSFGWWKEAFKRPYSLTTKLLILFGFLGLLSVMVAYSKTLALYTLLRLIVLILFGLSVGELIKLGILRISTLFCIITTLAVVQAIIAFGQFSIQSGLGLQFLGEPTLNQAIPGIAKIPVEGFHFIRGYGTFPHPNVLSAFLLFGLLSLYYFYLKNDWALHKEIYDWQKGYKHNFKIFVTTKYFYTRIMAAIGMFLIILGLVVASSRAAWIVGIVTTAFLILMMIFRSKKLRKSAIRLLIIIFAIVAIITIKFDWVIFPRAIISTTEPAVTERLTYNDLGIELINQNPILGVGIGNQVLHSVKNNSYQEFGMDKVWQWQPVHNIYILTGSEVGILATGVLIIFLLTALVDSLRKRSLENQIVATFLLLIILLGFLDHFLWTLQPGRMMFWFTIALVLGLYPSSDIISTLWLKRNSNQKGKNQ